MRKVLIAVVVLAVVLSAVAICFAADQNGANPPAKHHAAAAKHAPKAGPSCAAKAKAKCAATASKVAKSTKQKAKCAKTAAHRAATQCGKGVKKMKGKMRHHAHKAAKPEQKQK